MKDRVTSFSPRYGRAPDGFEVDDGSPPSFRLGGLFCSVLRHLSSGRPLEGAVEDTMRQIQGAGHQQWLEGIRCARTMPEVEERISRVFWKGPAPTELGRKSVGEAARRLCRELGKNIEHEDPPISKSVTTDKQMAISLDGGAGLKRPGAISLGRQVGQSEARKLAL